MINFIKSLLQSLNDNRSGVIRFGNITGSGLPIEHVKKNAHLYPLSGLPESEQAREEFVVRCGGGGGSTAVERFVQMLHEESKKEIEEVEVDKQI